MKPRDIQQIEKLDVPKLDCEIKNLNGKSGRKLMNCIEKLDRILDPKKEEKEAQKE